MTATDQPTPRVGEAITTAEQLDALPVGSVVHATPMPRAAGKSEFIRDPARQLRRLARDVAYTDAHAVILDMAASALDTITAERDALAAARAGEPCARHAFPNDPDDPRTCIRCGAGEAVDREALAREVRTAVSLWDNDGDVRGRPDSVWAAIDREAAYITTHLFATVLAARGDAAPRVSAEQVRTLASESGRPATTVLDWLRTAGIGVQG